jgi:hypothetical protein
LREAVGICIDECGANKKYLKFIWLILAEFLCDYVIKLYSCVWMRLAVSEVILIGDRAVGKTQSVKMLLTPGKGNIRISNLDSSMVANDATKDILNNTLEIQAGLRVSKKISVRWVDTPGGWNENEWQNNPCCK